MGFLGTLLTLPLSGPIKGVLWLADTLHDRAEDEIYSPERIRAQLTDLELRLDLGEIDEETYQAAEDDLLARLRVARQRIAERGR